MPPKCLGGILYNPLVFLNGGFIAMLLGTLQCPELLETSVYVTCFYIF